MTKPEQKPRKRSIKKPIRKLELLYVNTYEEFLKLPVPTQVDVQMLRTICWIRGYKTHWLTRIIKDYLFVEIDPEVCMEIPDEMPTQTILDFVDEVKADFLRKKLDG